MKKCSKCNEYKRTEEFSRKSGYCKECQRGYSKKYYYANKERCKKHARRYYEINKERRQEYMRQYRKTHRKQYNEYMKQYLKQRYDDKKNIHPEL